MIVCRRGGGGGGGGGGETEKPYRMYIAGRNNEVTRSTCAVVVEEKNVSR